MGLADDGMGGDALVVGQAADEIERLRVLITEWVEAYLDNTRQDAEHASAIDRYCDAVDALLKEAGQ
jgi:hypothetical protein